MGWRFASLEDREAITGLAVDAAERVSPGSPHPSWQPARSSSADRTGPRGSGPGTRRCSHPRRCWPPKTAPWPAPASTGATVPLETVERIARKPDARGAR